MTGDEMIVVIQAHKEGKIIECKPKKNYIGDWVSLKRNDMPLWDFSTFEYRIKPESRYRPFRNAEEVIKAIKEHGSWLKLGNSMMQIIGSDEEGIYTKDDFYAFWQIPHFTFADGTPFGVKED